MMYRILERVGGFSRAVFALSLVVVLLLPSEAAAQATDGKVWAGFVGRVELSKPLKIDIEHQQRFSFDTGQEKSITEVMARYEAHEYLKLGATYRLIDANDPDGLWHRVYGDLGTSYDMGNIELSYRLRLQSTIRPTETLNAIRNKVGLDYKLGGGLTAEGAAELHYSSTNSEFNEIRIVGGVDKKVSDRLKVGGFYMFQNEFNKRNGEYNHIFGLGVTYVFRKYEKPKGASDSGDAKPAASESSPETSETLDP